MNMPLFILLSAIAARTAIVFVALAFAIRMTGRRQFGEIDLKDVMVMLMVSNAVQNSMTLGVGRLSVALVSAGTIIFLAWLFVVGIKHRPAWQRICLGAPEVLAYNGRLIEVNMRRQGVTYNELMGAIRNTGLNGMHDVRLAVLEVDGSISVIHRHRNNKRA